GTNHKINFQGKVVNTDGTNVANGSYNFDFNIYTASSGGVAVWTESKSLTVTDGIFRTDLGDTTALPGSVDFNTDNIYLGVDFNSDGEMSPRVQFSAVPQALNAEKVAGLTVTNTTGTLTIPSGKTIQFGDAFTTSGAFATTLTVTGVTGVTLPTSGTLYGTATGSITSSQLATSLSDETGSGLAVFGTAPTLAGTLTFSGFSTNGGLLYTNGSGVVSQTGAGTSTTVLHGGTTPSYGAVSLTADVSGTLPVANGGTGSATQNFVDLTTGQTVAGAKVWSNLGSFSAGITQTAGATSLTSGNATQVTTASALALNVNSLTTGTGFYIASSTLTSGKAVDIQVSGTAAAASQTALNILTAGATATNAITTYGAQISNTHTNATSGTNVALYLNASGATTANYGLIVNAGNVGIGTTTPSTALQLLGTTPVITLSNNYLVTQGWQLRNGAIGAGNASFDIYDSTDSVSRFVVQADGNVNIGATNNPANNSRLYVYGGGNGANVDVRGNGAVSDQAVIELEGSDYDSTPNSTLLQYFGPNGLGTTMGYNNQKLGVLSFNGATTAMIRTSDATALHFGTNNTERMSISSAGAVTINAFSTNGGLLYTNGSGVVSQTGAGTSTTVLHGGTTPSYGAVGLTTDVTGTLPVANGGTGQTSYTNGQLLIGNTTGNTLTKASLTGTSNQITVTGGAGSITLSTPQDIATTSTPQFANIGIGGAASTTSSIFTQGNALTGTTQYAFRTQTTANENATTFYGQATQVRTKATSFTLTTGNGLHVFDAAVGAGSVITTLTGVDIDPQTGGGSANIGIRSLVASSATGAYNLYIAGTAQNYFAGNVGFGNTAPAQKVDVSGTIRQSNAVSCGLSTNASGDIICTSDERLKDLHGFYDGGLTQLNAVNPIRFNYKNDDYLHVGFSAQNIASVLPEGAPVQANGFYGLDSNAVLALTVNSVKQLNTQISSAPAYALATDAIALAKRITNLETQITSLTSAALFDVTTWLKTNIIFDGLVTFNKDITLVSGLTINGLANFRGELSVSDKQAGFAKMLKDVSSVAITFTTPLANTPIIQITPQDYSPSYWVDTISTTGFTLHTQTAVSADTKYSWTAITAQDPKTTVSDPAVVTPTPSPTPSATPVITPTPTPSPSATPTPTPSSAPSATPDIPTPTPSETPSPTPDVPPA
ncbi:MAG: tail fiber domain-containing protein, partial [Candidatus Andersenbacteria bacterium]